jgi:hypothetical protein
MRWFITAAGFMLLVPAAAHQDVALKELMPSRCKYPWLRGPATN